MALGSMDILTILILLIHEHGIYFHLCFLHFLSSESYSFQRSFTLSVKFISEYFTGFNAIVSEIVFFISLGDILLLVYRNEIDFVC